jgi:hypothetical protein
MDDFWQPLRLMRAWGRLRTWGPSRAGEERLSEFLEKFPLADRPCGLDGTPASRMVQSTMTTTALARLGCKIPTEPEEISNVFGVTRGCIGDRPTRLRRPTDALRSRDPAYREASWGAEGRFSL